MSLTRSINRLSYHLARNATKTTPVSSSAARSHAIIRRLSTMGALEEDHHHHSLPHCAIADHVEVYVETSKASRRNKWESRS